MTTTTPAKPQESQPAPPPSNASTIRLIVLLGLLAVVVGMLLIDQFVFAPGVKAADERLNVAAQEKMKAGVGEKGSTGAHNYLTQDEVHKVMGRGATSIRWNPEKTQAIETFAWWGYVPLPRHKLQVLYRKNKDNVLIYESHDGSQDFPKMEEPEVKPGNAAPRPDPATSEGGPKRPSDDGLDNTPPSSVTPPEKTEGDKPEGDKGDGEKREKPADDGAAKERAGEANP